MFQFTLRAARISCGYSLKDVAGYCNVSENTIRRYEKDSTDLPLQLILKLSLFYGVSFDLIYAGPEADSFKHNREVAHNREIEYSRKKEAV
jgi:transcriptional regulator with XRE-family HTH domain